MRIALVHDYFTQLGGAEKVAEEIACLLPSASIYSTVALKASLPPGLAGRDIHTSWMQRLPFMKKGYRLYFPLYPLGVESLDLTSYDLVISSSSGYAKGIRTRPDATHICYCHTPMRWAWEFDRYSAREKNAQLMRLLLPQVVKRLQKWDLEASRLPDYFLTNSQTVANRISQFYGRTARVIHPPIDIDRFRPSDDHQDYYLVLARMVSYKRFDLAIQACTALNRRLIVIGDGPDRARLESLAGPTVSFLGCVSDLEVEHYASRCRALIYAGEEDFGMALLEVAAAGRPTIAYRAGGATETIVEGQTGIFFDRQQPGDLAQAILEFERMTWNPSVLRAHAYKFRIEAFQSAFFDFLAEVGHPVVDPPAVSLFCEKFDAAVPQVP